MAKLDIAPPAPPKITAKNNSVKTEEEVAKPSEKKKGFFSNIFSATTIKKEVEKIKEKVEEEVVDLEKLRSKFHIPSKEEKQANKKIKKVDDNWTGGDIVEELQTTKKTGPRWDVEDPKHLKVKKTKKTKSKAVKKASKPRGLGKVDKVINQYFKTVEKEQKMLERELKDIIVHPKEALKKKQEYMIHHHEKMIKTMKQLLAAINTIDEVEFNRKVNKNKKAFTEWVKVILAKEKKAELQRNKILKQNMREMLKEYGAGLNKDINDKKYELDSRKKKLDAQESNVQKFDKTVQRQKEVILAKEKSVLQKDKHVETVIEGRIKKIIEKRLKTEQKALASTEKKTNELLDNYRNQSKHLQIHMTEFRKEKKDAEELMSKAGTLKTLQSTLQNRDAKLKAFKIELKEKESNLKDYDKDIQTREKETANRDKELNSEIKSLETREDVLEAKEKEAKLMFADYDTKKRELSMREATVKKGENYLEQKGVKLKSIKKDLISKESEYRDMIKEAREVTDYIEIAEQKNRTEKYEIEKLGFAKYLHSKFNYVSGKAKMSPEVENFYASIENCKNHINNNQLTDAKNAYSDIRRQFIQTNMNADDKEIIHNTLRELYDDINLAVISYR